MLPKRTPYSAPRSEGEARAWSYFTAPPCRVRDSSLSARAASGSKNSAATVGRILFIGSPRGEKSPPLEARHASGRHGRPATAPRPAWQKAGRRRAPEGRGSFMPSVKLELQKDLARHLRAGHPWVFRRALEKAPAGLERGAIVDVTDRGKFVARGYYDPRSHITVRVLTLDPAEAVGPHFWRRRIAKAVALRRSYAPFSDPAVTDCVRLVHGEGDGLPGVVADLYGKFAVLKLYSAGLAPYRAQIVEALRGEVELSGVYGRDDDVEPEAEEDETALEDDSGPARRPRGQVLWGE